MAVTSTQDFDHADATATKPQTIALPELVKLCAIDTELYGKTFFPQTFRQASPSFAPIIWQPLEDPSKRLVCLTSFRGSSKTSRLRIFVSKRIAYGISRTILYLGISEGKAIESVNWLRNRMERNHFWRTTFGLEKGSKWEEAQLEIIHKTLGHSIRVIGAGVTGGIRGLNIDDYRPDLIIVDDPQNDETAATETQREKLVDLILGAVKNSLAPIADEPNSKMVLAITPQHADDVSQQAARDPQWTTVIIPCWTKATLELDVDQQKSAWEERFPTAELRADKKFALARNRLSVFAREMECRLVSKETSQFRPAWLRIREVGIAAPRGAYAVLAIDPVPPPSDAQMARGLSTKDFEAHYVWSRSSGDYHLCDFARSRGHDPSWTIATAFALARTWRVARIVVDAVAYQRTLKWLLEQAMKSTGVYYAVIPIADGMAKFARISNVIGGLASQGKLVIGAEHTIFAQQFRDYGPTYTGIDDDLDASALCLQELSDPYLDRLNSKGQHQLDSEVEDFPFIGACP